MSRAVAYTVFTSGGDPRLSPIGMVVFTRSLAAARGRMSPGDTVTGWTASGAVASRRIMLSDLSLRKIRRRHG